MQSKAVVCKNLRKDFGKGEDAVKVLRGVDFQVNYGEMTFLVGPSGCGKTTLLSVVAGLLNPTAGDLAVLDADIAKLHSSEAVLFRRKNLGFVFQQFNLLPALTAAENAAVPLLAAGWSRKPAVEKAVVLLRDLGLGERAHAKPNQLSGGQQQRVAFARALIHEPRLLVCDEPTSALDAETGHHVMELLRKSAVRADRAVLVVTHDSRIYNFADRIAYMNDGLITRIEEQQNAA
ncbi:MAG: ABC transporter ATP-binding protein [Bryobacteraceae bacterium]|nr:ABC transporter ATP-binding protein [Bryobacteraceae bacterium]